MKSNENWIAKAIQHPGAFTAKAKAARLTARQYAAKVLDNPGGYSQHTVKQARLAQTLGKISRKNRNK